MSDGFGVSSESQPGPKVIEYNVSSGFNIEFLVQ